MRISQVEISNFRGIQSAKVYLPKQGVIFGPNNVGKTTITDALALTLGREQMAPAFTDWDFYGGIPKPESRIEIIATVTSFGDNASPEDFPDWFRGERCARPVWWNEQTRIISTDADCPVGHELAVH